MVQKLGSIFELGKYTACQSHSILERALKE
jgi:hypothetical protein